MSADLPVVKVGDVDPTYGFEPHAPACEAETSAGLGSLTYLCTWSRGHAGQHVAGDGAGVCAVWGEAS